jgi:hypothetical protein
VGRPALVRPAHPANAETQCRSLDAKSPDGAKAVTAVLGDRRVFDSKIGIAIESRLSFGEAAELSSSESGVTAR